MAVIDLSSGAGQALCAQELDRVPALTNVIDFSENEMVDADNIKVFDLPALSRIKGAIVQVITTEGGTGVGSLGTVSDPDSLLNHIDFDTLGYYHNGEVGAAEAATECRGHHQTEEVKIDDLLLSGEDVYISCSGEDLDTAVVRVTIFVEDYEFPAPLA